MKILTTKNTIIALLILLFTWLGLLKNTVSILFGGIVYCIISYALCFLSFMMDYKGKGKSKHLKKTLFVLLLFSICYFLFSFLYQNGHFTTVLGYKIPVYSYNTIFNIPIWIANINIITRCSYLEKKKLFKYFNAILFYDVLITSITLLYDPNYARLNSAGQIIDSSKIFSLFGAMGYELTYSIVILLPLYFYIWKITKKKRYIAFALLLIYYVYMSAFLIAIISVILNISLCFIMNIKNKIVKITIILSLFIISTLLISNMAVIGHLLVDISKKVPIYEIQQRFVQLSNWILYNDNSGASLFRFDLYRRSLDGIIRHPILGELVFDRTYPISDHSTLLDVWCGFGMIPFILFVSIPIRMISYFRISKNVALYYAFLSSILTFLFVSYFNQVLISPNILLVILVILPIADDITDFSTKEVDKEKLVIDRR